MLTKPFALFRAGAVAAAFALLLVSFAPAQVTREAITLVKAGPPEALMAPVAGGHSFVENYRDFGRATVGHESGPEVFELAFHEPTKVTGISAAGDFHVAGGSCSEGHTYQAGDVCSVEVVFTPQGPGHRTGRLQVAHTASANPFVLPMGGEGNGPAISFTPSKITIVESTRVDGTGVLVNAQGLAIDGGDNLYIADTGNNLIRWMDSSGVLTTLVGGGTDTCFCGDPASEEMLSSPYGVAIDFQGNVYFTDSGKKLLLVLSPISQTPDAPLKQIGSGSFDGQTPYGVAVDPSGNLFLMFNTNDLPYFYMGEQIQAWNDGSFSFLESANVVLPRSYPIAVDAGDNVYYNVGCSILGQNPAYGAQAKGGKYWIAAGSGICGFSGDGGLAIGAEFSSSIQGFAWDAAGNFYFTDTGNNRVRRIDAIDGVIRTVAGNGKAGFTGDDGPSTSAELNSPTGIAVDSHGNVYIISTQEVVAVKSSNPVKDAAPEATGPGGPTESVGLVREFGAVGRLEFASQGTGTSSAAQMVMVSNVGNAALNFTRAAVTSGNVGDFAIDPNSTTCNFTLQLASGENCWIGVIFTPGAEGARSAVLTVLDNTANGSNVIDLSGTGAAPAAKPKVTLGSEANPAVAGKTLELTAKVAGESGAAPTGDVELREGSKILLTEKLSSGAVTFKLSNPSTGTYLLTAHYMGDKAHLPTQSNTIKQVVEAKSDAQNR